jgi:hypothetical protein
MKKKPAGQAVLETVLALFPLIFASFALMQIAHLIYAQGRVDHASFMAAREASIVRIQPRDILQHYRQALGRFAHGKTQLEISVEINHDLALLKLRTTQGYVSPFPWIGILLVKVSLAIRPAQEFEKHLLEHKQLPLHSELVLPLPRHIPPYPELRIMSPHS